jgi:diacylglycerol kinase (ATP)
VDGVVREIRALMLIVANSRFAGGHVPLAPDARPDDGRLDVVAVEPLGPLALGRLVPLVFQGRHTGHPRVQVVRGRTASIESDPPMWVNLDGDTWRAGHVSFEVLPAALEVLVP